MLIYQQNVYPTPRGVSNKKLIVVLTFKNPVDILDCQLAKRSCQILKNIDKKQHRKSILNYKSKQKSKLCKKMYKPL